jgi:hypothetical protein
MGRLAALEAPMSRLATAAALLDHPVLLVLMVLAALLAWGAVTFAAVRFAILSAARVSRRNGGALMS